MRKLRGRKVEKVGQAQEMETQRDRKVTRRQSQVVQDRQIRNALILLTNIYVGYDSSYA